MSALVPLACRLAMVAAMGLMIAAPVSAQVPQVGATAEVRDASNRLVATAEFREGRGEVLITIIFPSPATLTGTHGVRIHEMGRCDPPEFLTAGGGFNPLGKQHGRQNPEGSQVGDLPNVNFTTGLTSYNTTAVGATLAAGRASLLGPNKTALIIYANPDDQITDPDGKAGARIACGVITQTSPAGGNPVAAQPVVPKPAVSPLPTSSPPPAAVVQPVATKPAASPVAPANPAARKPAPSLLPTVVPSASPPLQPAAPQPVATTPQATPSGGTGIPPLVAFIVAVLAVGAVAAGLLLRRRGQLP